MKGVSLSRHGGGKVEASRRGDGGPRRGGLGPQNGRYPIVAVVVDVVVFVGVACGRVSSRSAALFVCACVADAREHASAKEDN